MTTNVVVPVVPPTAARERFAAAYGVLGAAIAQHAFPGCAFGVLAGGEVVLQDSLGRFTYDDASPAVKPQTMFDVASLTKVVATTAAAMLLYQRGLLDLEMPVGELLPGFVVGRPPGTPARRVTLRHLLAHTSGLPAYVEFFRTAHSSAALFRACLELQFEAQPGERATYSDPGFLLLGKALEVLMHEHLSNWTRREIFHPLELSATGFTPLRYHSPAIPPTESDTQFRNRVIQGEVQDENAWILDGVAGHAGPHLALASSRRAFRPRCRTCRTHCFKAGRCKLHAARRLHWRGLTAEAASPATSGPKPAWNCYCHSFADHHALAGVSETKDGERSE